MIFIIGLRRSGTTLLFNLLKQSPSIRRPVFEPHDLYHAIAVYNMRRYRRWAEQIIKSTSNGDLVKFALNPGIYAKEWKAIPTIFPDAKIVFIIRDTNNTWKSYKKLDHNIYRGICGYNAYCHMAEDNKGDFWIHIENNPRSCIISYEDLTANPNEVIQRVCNHVGIKSISEDPKEQIKNT